MLTRETVAAPPEVAARLARAAGEMGQPLPRILAQRFAGLALVVALVFGAIALLDLLFGIVQASHWLVLSLGAALLLVPVMVLTASGEIRVRGARQAEAAKLRSAAAGGQVLRCTLTRDARHWFVEHEHGVILVCPADADRTLFLDLSSVADDERWEEWYAKGRAHRATWRWFAATDGSFSLGFEASGAPLPPNSLEAAAGGYDPETGGALFEFLGSPADGEVLDRPFDEVDAFLRTRIGSSPAPA